MESGWSLEHNSLISELVEGMELAKQLRTQLSTTSSAQTREMLVQRILSSYEKALMILNWSGPMGQLHHVGPTAALPESPLSINGSPRSDNQDQKDGSKKRKLMPKWTDQVRVSSENGLEGPHDDGFSWRKYGQKDILGAKFPRSYYRCTYRNTQNCWATKQVQRSDEDPTVFEITYRGRHTCSHGNQSNSSPASPEKQEQEQITHHNNHNTDNQLQQQSQELLNFRNSLRVNTMDLDNKEMASNFCFPSTSFGCMKGTENHCFSDSILESNTLFENFSPSFIAPATPEINYFSVSSCQMNNFGELQHGKYLDSDLHEIISAHTSATNSPTVNLDFSLDPVEIDPNFPFNTPGFFS